MASANLQEAIPILAIARCSMQEAIPIMAMASATLQEGFAIAVIAYCTLQRLNSNRRIGPYLSNEHVVFVKNKAPNRFHQPAKGTMDASDIITTIKCLQSHCLVNVTREYK
jgi:hypothetical protein